MRRATGFGRSCEGSTHRRSSVSVTAFYLRDVLVGRASLQRDGVAQHAIPHSRPQCSLGCHVNFGTKEILEGDQEISLVEQAAAGLEIDKKIDIAAIV